MGLKAIFGIAGILIYSCYFSFSQNLVPNSSFEVYSSCPINPSAAVYLAIPWFKANVSSPDYWHQCAGYVPNNSFGSQSAKTGDGYLGIFAYEAANPNTREYIEVLLSDTLKANKKYCVEFYVSLGDNARYAVDGMGAYFSIDSIYDTTYFYLQYQPQVENPLGSIISDTNGWTLISGDFIAQGGEKYLIIGNFKNDATTTVDTINLSGGIISYYYIDEVSVYYCGCDTVAPVAKFNYTADTLTATFNNLSSAYSNYWFWDFGDGNTSTEYNPVHTYDSAGVYTVTFVACYGFCCDTMVASVAVNDVGIGEKAAVGSSSKLLRVYPNPAGDKIVFADNFSSGTIKIRNLVGQEIYSGKFEKELNVSSLPRGIYMVEIITGQKIHHSAFVKE